MSLQYADRVQETSTTTGTGTYSLAGAVSGFRTFVAGVGNGNTCYYYATDGTDWEVGIGTVTDATPDTLARTTILASSNAGSAVNWSTGTRTLGVGIPATAAKRLDYQRAINFASVGSIGNDTLVLLAYAPFAGTIDSLKALKLGAGTVTAAVKINGTNVTGLSSLSVTTTSQAPNASGANTFSAGDAITLVLSSNASGSDLQGTLLITPS